MLEFGFIGCGKVSKFHAEVLLSLKEKIVGVAARSGSRNIENFSKKYEIPKVYEDWKRLVGEVKPDALVVSVSWNNTEKIIQDVINTGIPCLVEKPVALTSYKLKEIIRNSSSNSEKVLIGYNRRFYDFIPIIQKALKEKELLSIELNFPEALDQLIKFKSPRIAEHILMYMSSHWFDLLWFLIGEIKVEWIKKKQKEHDGYIMSYNGILVSVKYDTPIHLQINFNAPSNTYITFNFSDSIYRLCPIEQLTVFKGMEIIESGDGKPIKKYVPKIENILYTDSTYKPGFLNQMKYFIDVFVQKGKRNKIGCTLEDALNITLLTEKIRYG